MLKQGMSAVDRVLANYRDTVLAGQLTLEDLLVDSEFSTAVTKPADSQSQLLEPSGEEQRHAV
jgi:hypothetical protein